MTFWLRLCFVCFLVFSEYTTLIMFLLCLFPLVLYLCLRTSKTPFSHFFRFAGSSWDLLIAPSSIDSPGLQRSSSPGCPQLQWERRLSATPGGQCVTVCLCFIFIFLCEDLQTMTMTIHIDDILWYAVWFPKKTSRICLVCFKELNLIDKQKT